MKKAVSLLIACFLCLLMCPLLVSAKDKAVTVTDKEATNSTVTVSGTTEALAVIVQVRDLSDSILDMKSFAVLDGKFSGSIDGLSLKNDTEYKVYVADYEGGDWTTVSVIVKPKADPSPNPSPEPSPDSSPSPKPSGSPSPDNSPMPSGKPDGNSGGGSNNGGSAINAPKIDEVPKTKDDNNILLWSLVLGGGILALAGTTVIIIKKINKE